MKSCPECLTCIFKQAISTSKIASEDPKVHETVVRKLAARVAAMNLETDTPAAVSQHVYEIVHEVSGVYDPYAEVKRKTNRQAKELLPTLERLVFSSGDSLKSAVHIAVAGNVIDLGINHELDVNRDVLPVAEQEFAIDDIEPFRRDIRPGVKILYLADNSGEIVFDRVLVEELIERGANVTFAVKSGPIINDVTMEDAEFTGITDITKVIETGSAHIGIRWESCSGEFRNTFISADVIISKGHGNFETLSEMEGNIYFILKAKCECVARELGVDPGSIVFKKKPLTVIPPPHRGKE